jgi:predicted metal-dependent hydrolase
MAYLKFITDQTEGETVLLQKNKTIFGRHQSCDCRLPGKTVSREHFAIEHNNGTYFLVDLGSANGTLANGDRVSWIELHHGDTINAGPYVMVFHDDGEANKASAEEPPNEDAAVSGARPPFTDEHVRVYPRQYLEGIEHFNARRYFDAHEVWEEIWLSAADQTKLFYQMLIQAAVGLHHYERANPRGATGMYQNVIVKLERLPAIYMSIDLDTFARQFKSFFVELIENERAELDSGGAEAAMDKPRPVIELLEIDANTDEQRTQWE